MEMYFTPADGAVTDKPSVLAAFKQAGVDNVFVRSPLACACPVAWSSTQRGTSTSLIWALAGSARSTPRDSSRPSPELVKTASVAMADEQLTPASMTLQASSLPPMGRSMLPMTITGESGALETMGPLPPSLVGVVQDPPATMAQPRRRRWHSPMSSSSIQTVPSTSSRRTPIGFDESIRTGRSRPSPAPAGRDRLVTVARRLKPPLTGSAGSR